MIGEASMNQINDVLAFDFNESPIYLGSIVESMNIGPWFIGEVIGTTVSSNGTNREYLHVDCYASIPDTSGNIVHGCYCTPENLRVIPNAVRCVIVDENNIEVEYKKLESTLI